MKHERKHFIVYTESNINDIMFVRRKKHGESKNVVKVCTVIGGSSPNIVMYDL